MIRPEPEPVRHLSMEQLARLAERGADAAPEATIQHLATCHRCFGTYCELAHQRVAWLGHDARSTSAHHDLAMSVAGVRAPHRRPWHLAWVPALGIAGLLVAWLVSSPREAPPAAPTSIPPAVLSAIQRASSRGLVYPGGEAGADEALPRYRSGSRDGITEPFGGAPVGRALPDTSPSDGNLDSLDEESSFWRASEYLANDLFDNARIVLDRARKQFPTSDRLAILGGILAYRQNDIPRATDILEAVVRRSPDDAVARFDLGYALEESGDPRGAELLTEVAERFPDTPLGRRALAELDASHR